MDSGRETALIGRLSRGDEKAFAELYGSYKGVSYAFVYSLVKDSSVSKDIVHDVFVKLWTRRESMIRVVSFNAYLFQMLKNAVYDYLETVTANRSYVTEMMRTSDDFSDMTSASVSFDELQLIIFDAVSKLPQRRREVFQMSRYQHLENSEIALRLGIDRRTVENHITSALAEIRQRISEAYV